MMKTLIFSLLVLIAGVLWDQAQASGNDDLIDCCLATSANKIPFHNIMDYSIQQQINGCKINAVVFITMKMRKLCATPNLKWVKKYIRKLKRSKNNSKNRRQGNSNGTGNGN
eukprot:gi/632986246/ref/XP_007910128.1/ PREDICTED: C-C motif chemokine 19-like [Callorhinchus milii]